MDVCMWVSICVRRRAAKEGILSSAFLTVVRVSSRIALFILAQRPHKELCPRKPARPEEKIKDVKQSGVKLQSRIQTLNPKTYGWSVGSKTWVQSRRRVVWSQERRHGAVKTMTKWVGIFGSCVGFSLSFRDIHTENFKSVSFTLLGFAVLNPHLSFLLSTLCLCLVFIFVQPVKCPHGQVWEETTGSKALEERPNQQNPTCDLFHKYTNYDKILFVYKNFFRN